AALGVGPNLFHVVLHALELLEHAIVLDHDAAARHADERIALHNAIRDVAARHRADARDAEHGPDLGMTDDLFAQLRLQQAFGRLADVVGDVIEHLVRADLDVLVFRHAARRAGGQNVEADD